MNYFIVNPKVFLKIRQNILWNRWSFWTVWDKLKGPKVLRIKAKKPIVPESDNPWSTLWLSKLTSEKTYPSHWKSPNFFSNSPNSKTRLTFIENRGFRKWSLFSFSILEGVEKKMMMRLKNRQAISVRKKGFRNKTFVSSNPGNYWPATVKQMMRAKWGQLRHW